MEQTVSHNKSFHIQSWDGSNSTKYLSQLKSIFFESSDRKSFSNACDKEEFFETWTSYYFNNCAESIFLATHKNTLLGYLTGCKESLAAKSFFQSRLPYYGLFEDLFVHFPAHLHINFTAQARGKGIGSLLIQKFTDQLQADQIPGVHIVTSPGKQNVQFYKKNGFEFETEREWKSHPLLFMGRNL